MVQPKKFKGVRQLHWGSWVSEIRHPLVKKRVRLGTFDTAEEAARVHDATAIILSGRNAKTNFPAPQTSSKEYNHHYSQSHYPNFYNGNRHELEKQKGNPSFSSSSSYDKLSKLLHAKLKRTTKTPSPSLTCLRLDPENALIGVWQKKAGPTSDSRWITKVKLEKSNPITHGHDQNVPLSYANINTSNERVLNPSTSVTGFSSKEGGQLQGVCGSQEDLYCFLDQMDEERIALQMIDEMLAMYP